jgi:hypothetical protein
VHGPTKIDRPRAKACVEGEITYDPGTADRLARWKDEKEPWALGYWLHDWAEQRQRIASIDPAAHRMTLAQPYHHTATAGRVVLRLQPAVRDRPPRQWYLTGDRHHLLLAPCRCARSGWQPSSHPTRLARGAQHDLSGLHLQAARGTTVRIENAFGNRVEDCTLRNMSGP